MIRRRRRRSAWDRSCRRTTSRRRAEEADLEEVYSAERHLLYVACTRARDRLLLTGVEPASEFIDDLRG